MTQSLNRQSDIWLDAQDLAEREAITPRAIRKRIASLNGGRHLYVREVASPSGGGRGGLRLQFNVTALQRDGVFAPAPAPRAQTTTQIVTLPHGGLVEKPAPQQTLALPFARPEIAAQLSTIPPSARPLAEARARAIELLTSGDWKLWRGRTVHGIRIARLTDAIAALAADSRRAAAGHKGELAPWRDIQEELRRARHDKSEFLPISRGTLWRWWAWHKNGRTIPARGSRLAEPKLLPGIVALHDPPPPSAGQSKYFAAHPNAAKLLICKRLGEALNVRHCYDILCREWSTLGEAGAPPSYKTCLRLLDNPRCLPAHVADLVDLGPRKWAAQRGPSVLRERPAPMDWWVLDHREHDTHIVNTLFAELPRAARYRLWMTLVLDWGSDCIVGWCFSPVPNSNTINSAMRMAILACQGFPPHLYFDRGKDFAKVQRTITAELEGLLRNHRVQVTRALPYNARAKYIENRFGAIFAGRFDREWGPAYAGRNAQERREVNQAAQRAHAQHLAGKRASSPLPADREFIAHALQSIEEHNSTPKKFLGGRSPREVFDTRPPQAAPDRRLLDCLFALRDRRSVGDGGTVRIDNLLYEPEESSVCRLAGWQGREKILVARDPYNLSTASAFDPLTGQFLGELRIQPRVPMSPHGQAPLSQAGMAAMRRRRRALTRNAQDYIAAFLGGAEEIGLRTEIEYRSARMMSARIMADLTGTDGAAVLDAAPAARPESRCLGTGRALPPAAAAPAFVSDAVEEHGAIFDHIEIEPEEGGQS